MTRIGATAVVLTGMLLVAACGDGGVDAARRAQFLDEATSGPSAFSEEEANCIWDRFEEEGIELSDLEPDEGSFLGQQDAYFEIVFGCAGLEVPEELRGGPRE